ncbi:MAG: phosphocholine cytidylyltransferase family protein [Planctomycetaceae bacterium]|jgi:choline kinase|nr:phosphocholine cytidylyltransferase family protein [Planctomycetaceae bacterium]
MKMIILAAGQGTRLRPHTDSVPKCMVMLNGKPLIYYQLETARRVGITDIVVVGGYKTEVLREYLADKNVRLLVNNAFSATNMVSTLFCAESELNGDIIISYSDIVYSTYVLRNLINCNNARSTVVDSSWRELWSKRMENPLGDAETMKLDANGFITELGKKPTGYHEIEGQYIGLTKIIGSVIDETVRFYHQLDRNIFYDGKDFNNMYMTSFLQLMINNHMPIKAAMISGGWFEVDSNDDLDYYETNFENDLIQQCLL